MTRPFADAANCFGLQINTDKTVVMYQPPPRAPYEAPLAGVGDVELRDVSTFVYLRSTITNYNSSDAEVVRRIQTASVAYGQLKCKVGISHSLRMDTKLALYRAVVLPTLLYALEACTLCRRHIKMLTAVQLWLLLGIRWQDYIPNVEVLKRPCMPSV